MDFWQYFIDTSEDVNGTGNVCNTVIYKAVPYNKKHEANYCVLYDAERNVIQVHFQKTCGKQDWKDNFNFPKELYDTFTYGGKPVKMYVHSGWGEMYKAVKHDMHVDFEREQRVHPTAKVECIGWSLGSALAQLAVQDLNWKYGRRPDCYTFGSVKPFYIKDKFVREYLDSCGNAVYNFCHRSDIVTYQPPFPKYEMLRRVDVGEYAFARLFDPWRWHTCYDRLYIYAGMEKI